MINPNPEDNKRLAEVGFGLDIEKFLRTDVGKYLTSRANEMRQVALEGLIEVDFDNSKAVLKLQTDARTPELFLTWLEEAVNNGRLQEQVLTEYD